MNTNFEKERSVLLAEIRSVFAELDKQFHLHGAEIPIEFGNDEDALGSYRPKTEDEPERFRFSGPFVAFSSALQLEKSDRLDLYKHEYAHYMTHYLDIPKEYTHKPGTHGSAWVYCCSLVGAVPSPYYKAGESRKEQNYDALLEKRKRIDYKTLQLLDWFRREQEAKASRLSVAKYKAGDVIKHPKYGEGTIIRVIEDGSAVKLEIQFGNETQIKVIDQAWLLRTNYQSNLRNTGM